MNQSGSISRENIRRSTAGSGSRGGSSGNYKRSGSRQGQSSRVSASHQVKKNRKRKPPFDYTKLIIGAVAVVIVVICVVLVSKAFSGKDKSEPSTETTTVEVTELQKEVLVEGITITGLSREQAKEEINQKLDWNMRVTYNGEEYEVSNMLETRVDDILKEIYEGTPKDVYNIDYSGLEETVQSEVVKIAKKWDVPAKNAAISSFDTATGKFNFADEQNGVVLDQEQLQSDILGQIKAKNFNVALPAKSSVQVPEITREQARDQYKVIGSFSTTTTSNKDRNTNIQLSAESFNGMIIQPGEEFSFNTTTGNRTLARGYKPAGAYVNGVLVEEPGGGVCQVSSTLYNAVVFAGLKTTERHAHSYEPSYVIPGEDAMVSYDGFAGPDMKFVNNTKDAIGMKASFSDRKLSISIYGISVLEEGVSIKMKSEKTAVLDPPAPTYEEDQTLQPGVEVIAKEAKPGSRWVTNILKVKDGTVLTDEFFHNSTYRGKAAVIKRNTSGVVIPTTGAATSAPASSESAADSTQASLPNETTASSGAAQPTTQTPTQPSTQPTTQNGGGPGNGTEAVTQPAGPGNDSGVIAPNPMS